MVNAADMRFIAFQIELFEPLRVFPEICGLGITPLNSFPVFSLPARIAYFRIFDGLLKFTLHLHRYAQPDDALCGLDPISVDPGPSDILHVVEENKLVGPADQVEISLPGNVKGLYDRDCFLHVVK